MACLGRGIFMKMFKKCIFLLMACLIFTGVNVYAGEVQSAENEAQQTDLQAEEVGNASQTKDAVSAPSLSQNVVVDNIITNESANGIYDISLPILVGNEYVKEVRFAIWSELNGQDDLRWYSAVDIQSNYVIQWDVRAHYGLGNYYVEAYVELVSGESICVKKSSFTIEQSKPQDVEITVDNGNGIATVSISNYTNSSLLKTVEVAVWSEAQGQDDLLWYTLNGDEQMVDIKDHLYSTGKYFVHFYITDITGYRYFGGSYDFEFQIEKGIISITPKSDTVFQIELKDAQIPGGIREVSFPIWSAKNDQDDIRWYTAQESNGVYTTEISVKDHKSLGNYEVHAYAYTTGGKQIFLTKNQFVAEAPKIGEIDVPDDKFDKEEGRFRIVLSNIENSGMIQKLEVPVWSEENGQDDIIWYNAKKQNDGEYYVDIDIRDHKYSYGQYNIHVYCTDITGDRFFAGKTSKEIDIIKGSLSVNKESEEKYTVILSGVNVPGGAKKIEFPIWSEENGQDDIQWYTAHKQSNGDYAYQISLKKHKGLGDFFVHAYATTPNGEKIFLGKTSFQTSTPQIGRVKVDNIDHTSGKFQVVISGIKNQELIDKIQVPIWADVNQADIIWYAARRNSDGNYVVDVDIANHDYRCDLYQIHVYLTDITGVMSMVGKTSHDMSPTYSEFIASDIDGLESNYIISLDNLEVPAGETQVRFAVWGKENGQNDLRWYNAVRQKKGNYACEIKISDHCEFGEYEVHAYCYTRKNVAQFVGKTGFELTKKPSISLIQISEKNSTIGTFRVTINGVFAPSGVTKVEIPIWCEDNQSDVSWYTASKVGDSTYQVNVKVSNHKHHFGNYKVHVYVTMGNGVRKFAGESSTDIEPINYVYSSYISPTQREVVILGVTADMVQFPTWSEANGQDDVIWYTGNNCGNGKWNIVVDSKNHSAGGTYSTHIYTTVNGMKSCVGTTSYSLQWIPTEQALMNSRANLYSSSTPFLMLVNRSTHKVGIYQGWQGNWNCIQYWDCSDGAPSTPTVEGTFRVGSRGHHFYSGSSICYWYTQFYGNYLFHSVLYNRYTGSLADGRLGMALSHGCVRLDINNAKWIYDTIPTGTTVVVYH